MAHLLSHHWASNNISKEAEWWPLDDQVGRLKYVTENHVTTYKITLYLH